MQNRMFQLFTTLGIVCALSVFLPLAPTDATAAAYPNKPVRLIIPNEPGGGTDIIGRQIAAKLSDRLGKPIVVENRAGAGGLIATELVSKADPDGHTLLAITPAFTTMPSLQKLPYDSVKSFTPIAKLATGATSLVVNPRVPANSVRELIALARQKPGQLIFASSGAGTSIHMGIELFKMMADIDFKIVQFKGGGPVMVDVIGGHSDACMSALMQTLPHIKSGKFRALGTSGLKRSSALPDVPTISEAGVPGYESTMWWGILAPAGTPSPIVERLNKELQEILALDEIKKWIQTQGSDADYMDAADFAAFLQKDIQKWASVIQKANIKLQE